MRSTPGLTSRVILILCDMRAVRLSREDVTKINLRPRVTASGLRDRC